MAQTRTRSPSFRTRPVVLASSPYTLLLLPSLFHYRFPANVDVDLCARRSSTKGLESRRRPIYLLLHSFRARTLRRLIIDFGAHLPVLFFSAFYFIDFCRKMNGVARLPFGPVWQHSPPFSKRVHFLRAILRNCRFKKRFNWLTDESPERSGAPRISLVAGFSGRDHWSSVEVGDELEFGRVSASVLCGSAACTDVYLRFTSRTIG